MTALKNWIAPIYLKEKKIRQLQKEFLQAKPFKHLQLRNFFLSEKLVEVLKALSSEEFIEKESDLFQFMQTNDLKYTQHPTLRAFVSFLYSKEFIAYMKQLTRISLSTKKADIAGTMYQDTDYLLPHDDKLDNRRIAFLCYLSTLLYGDGGTLDLFSSKNKKPTKVVKKLIPKFNTFTFFAVSQISYHQIAEITKPKKRIAIGGWYGD